MRPLSLLWQGARQVEGKADGPGCRLLVPLNVCRHETVYATWSASPPPLPSSVGLRETDPVRQSAMISGACSPWFPPSGAALIPNAGLADTRMRSKALGFRVQLEKWTLMGACCAVRA